MSPTLLGGILGAQELPRGSQELPKWGQDASKMDSKWVINFNEIFLSIFPWFFDRKLIKKLMFFYRFFDDIFN